MFQWLANLVSQVYHKLIPTSKSITNHAPLPVSSPAVKPENDVNTPVSISNADGCADKASQNAVFNKIADDPISFPDKANVKIQHDSGQPLTDEVLGIIVDTKQENSWDEGSILWTQYQFYLTNHSGKTIKDIDMTFSCGFKQVWNLIQHDGYMSLPEWATSSGFQIDSTVNFGGIFSEKPEIKIVRARY